MKCFPGQFGKQRKETSSKPEDELEVVAREAVSSSDSKPTGFIMATLAPPATAPDVVLWSVIFMGSLVQQNAAIIGLKHFIFVKLETVTKFNLSFHLKPVF